MLVVTGGLGRVATVLSPVLPPDTRLVDLRPGGERLDLSDPGQAAEAVRDADAVLHLAANPSPGQDWDTAYRRNVVATEILLRACGDRVPRVVLASSVHAMGLYHRPDRELISPEWTPRPCCAYGRSKVDVEELGRRHAERHGVSVVCLRLGSTGYPLLEQRYADMQLFDDDARQLVLAALTADVRFGVYFGVSANTPARWDIANARTELGYRPVHDSAVLDIPEDQPYEFPDCHMFA
ncbi:NAD-dependent epimerase/dehydratase family protein [Umezawaea endophytica]|uniref:NAD(P)-dependent oxidoreductase n=1 Tax=Umezawaea endophytica TaxID=1654476 RepID=A0A9X2VPT8_9PSEU|nr:NAD(P)-dependent oxidoreductase [Umezawaea endophytica]MCS7480470.1 NAD(P)-dependent oxidoreductase [Umezawaea endophytica]